MAADVTSERGPRTWYGRAVVLTLGGLLLLASASFVLSGLTTEPALFFYAMTFWVYGSGGLVAFLLSPLTVLAVRRRLSWWPGALGVTVVFLPALVLAAVFLVYAGSAVLLW